MIHSYDAPITKVFSKSALNVKNDVEKHFGVELEVECDQDTNKNNISDEIEEMIKGWGFIKHDGSLSYGFEIVTIPLTLKDHFTKWDELLKKSTELKLSSYSAQQAGMHVHYARRDISDVQLIKMCRLIFNKSNYIFLKKIAQRCQRNYGNFKGVGDFENSAIINKSHPFNNKYLALNVLPATTIEFRLFRGTLNKMSFLKNIEFCQAIIEFCALECHSVDYCSDWWNFMKFIQVHQSNYPLVYRFCSDKNIDTLEARQSYVKNKKAKKQKIVQSEIIVVDPPETFHALAHQEDEQEDEDYNEYQYITEVEEGSFNDLFSPA